MMCVGRGRNRVFPAAVSGAAAQTHEVPATAGGQTAKCIIRGGPLPGKAGGATGTAVPAGKPGQRTQLGSCTSAPGMDVQATPRGKDGKGNLCLQAGGAGAAGGPPTGVGGGGKSPGKVVDGGLHSDGKAADVTGMAVPGGKPGQQSQLVACPN